MTAGKPSARAHGVPLVALVAAAMDLSPGDCVGVLSDDDTQIAAPAPPSSPLSADPPPAAQP